MARAPLTFPAGLSRNATEYATRGRWWDGDKVRFRNGFPQSIGGWEDAGVNGTPATLDGVARSMLAFRSATEVAKYMAIGTHKKLYAYNDDVLTDITPALFPEGRVSSAPGRGYGVGPFGDDDYGTPRSGSSTSFVVDPTHWWLDTWGDELVACASHDGTIYTWDGNRSNIAVALSDPSVPVNNRGIFVTDERHLVAWGCGGNPRRLQWSDEEDYEEFAPGATTKAGDIEFAGINRIMSIQRNRNVNLVWCDNSLWAMYYQGAPFYYGFERIGAECGPISVKSMVSRLGLAYWMGKSSFFIYNGSVEQLPCEVESYIFENINAAHADKSFAFLNDPFDEVWFFIPWQDSEEPNFYVIYNYADNNWSFGFMARTAMHPLGTFATPIGTSFSGALYRHELGETANGADLGFRLESAPTELGEGEATARIKAVVPDLTMVGAVDLSFLTRFHPQGAETTRGPYRVSPDQERVLMRIAARQARLKIAGASPETFVRLGRLRVDVDAAGPR
ncbi:MAG: hypothetical protein AB7P02_17285 [Alphaproteobacteria bacterium]